MKKIQHPSNNSVLGAPPGVPIDQCEALPVTRAVTPDGLMHTISFWKPSAEDLALLNRGQAVRLVVVGTTHPPVHIGVDGDGDFIVRTT